jgi:hypothetical protein
MSVVRIESTICRSCGWQARAYVAKGQPRLTKFLADAEHGGKRAAQRKAKWHEARLLARARVLRGER